PGRNDTAWTTNTHRTSTAPMTIIGRNVYFQAHPRGIGHHRHFGVELHASSGKPVIMRAAPWDRRIEIHRKVRATTEASSTDVCIATTIPTAGAARNTTMARDTIAVTREIGRAAGRERVEKGEAAVGGKEEQEDKQKRIRDE